MDHALWVVLEGAVPRRLAPGIQSAARIYFGGSAAELTPEQYALLVGLVQSPSRYDPDCRPEAALHRRTDVLKALHRAHLLNAEVLAKALAAPLGAIPLPSLKRPSPPPAQ